MRALALLLLTPLLLAQNRPPNQPVLVPDVSQRDIRIIYSFTGAELLLFGAILHPGGRIPDKPADIIVVLKGPTESIVVREKRKIAGIWMNADSARFRSAPGFYAVASSRPIGEIIDERTAAIYELGVGNLQLSAADAGSLAQTKRFENGLVDLRQRNGLYVEQPDAVEITDGALYRVHIAIPARVPVGDYTAETFLVQDGRVLAGAVREIAIRKSGFERFVAMAAERWSFLYGVVSIALALLLGWAAGSLFRRV